MEELGTSNKKHEYGKHRMWGSIGFGGMHAQDSAAVPIDR